MNYNELEYHQNTGLLQTEDERQWGMFMHFSVLANMLVPFAGYVIPIVMWQTKKDQMPAIVAHGKEIVNWMITSFILSFIAMIIVVIGVVFIIAEVFVLGGIILALGVIVSLFFTFLSLVYAIYGGLQANKGENWEYPFNIKFIK